MSFAEVLAGLPEVDHLAGVELTGPEGEKVIIKNMAGSQGSLKVYHYLLQKYGSIDRDAANAGLILYSEHTFDARAHPGKHPNVDRLLAIALDGKPWTGQLQPA